MPASQRRPGTMRGRERRPSFFFSLFPPPAFVGIRIAEYSWRIQQAPVLFFPPLREIESAHVGRTVSFLSPFPPFPSTPRLAQAIEVCSPLPFFSRLLRSRRAMEVRNAPLSLFSFFSSRTCSATCWRTTYLQKHLCIWSSFSLSLFRRAQTAQGQVGNSGTPRPSPSPPPFL